jgi:hypothetical protein
MRHIQPKAVAINGESLGSGTSAFLDPVYLFKGMLRAAATRAKFHDLVDLKWLEGRFSREIQSRRVELNLQYIGLAMKRYPELELRFKRIGADIDGAKKAAGSLGLNNLPRPAPGDVLLGLLS